LVTYTVWHPPVIEEVDEESTVQTNDNLGSELESNLLVWVLGIVVAFLTLTLLFTRRQNSTLKQQVRPKQAPQMFMPPPMYADVPSAPDFSQMDEYVPPPNNEWDINQWK